MSQEHQPRVQSTGHPVSQSASQKYEDAFRRSADQEFLRSLSQLEQTLVADVDLAEISSLLTTQPEMTPEIVSEFLDDPRNLCQSVIHHIVEESTDFDFADIPDIEQFMDEQGIPIDSPIANYIRTAFAEFTKSAADVEPRTK